MAILKRKIKLDAMIGIGIEIQLPDKSVPFCVITPDGIHSEEATVEIAEREDEPDFADIQFSTAIGGIGLTLSLADLRKILEATKRE